MNTGLIKNRNKLMLSIPFTTIPIYSLVSLKFSQNAKKKTQSYLVTVVYNIGSRVYIGRVHENIHASVPISIYEQYAQYNIL